MTGKRSCGKVALAGALAASALVVAGCGQPSSQAWLALGPCVWKRLPATDRARVIAAVEDGRPVSAGPDGETLRDTSRKLAFACSTGAQLDPRRTGQIVSVSLGHEAAAELIEKKLGLTRRRVDVAISLAPQQFTSEMRFFGAMFAAGQNQGAPVPPLTPIFQSLNLPLDPAYETSPQGGWVAQYVLSDFALHAIAEGAPERR